jgi:hypothetical protein
VGQGACGVRREEAQGTGRRAKGRRGDEAMKRMGDWGDGVGEAQSTEHRAQGKKGTVSAGSVGRAAWGVRRGAKSIINV